LGERVVRLAPGKEEQLSPVTSFMKGWSRNGVTFGGASAVITLLLTWVGNATTSGEGCQPPSPLILLAFFVFLGLMAGTGFITARAGGTVGQATRAGLVGALISAVGTIIALAVVIGSINASECGFVNNTGVSTQTRFIAAGIIYGIIASLIGLGFGAGVGAIGGLIGRRPAATTV
jgi:hypothetical protein